MPAAACKLAYIASFFIDIRQTTTSHEDAANLSTRIAGGNAFYKQIQHLRSERCDERNLQRGTNHPAHSAVGLSIFSRINKLEAKSILHFHTGYSANNEVLSAFKHTRRMHKQPIFLTQGPYFLKKLTNGLRTQQFHFFHHNMIQRCIILK